VAAFDRSIRHPRHCLRDLGLDSRSPRRFIRVPAPAGPSHSIREPIASKIGVHDSSPRRVRTRAR
jgi:hypothetical protein